MRRSIDAIAGVVLLAAPTAIAFFSGGYFEEARLWAAIIAWAAVASLALFGSSPLPRSGTGRLALGGLALFTLWTGLSLIWTPDANAAYGVLERVLMYLAALTVAGAVLRRPALLRVAEPALAAGTLIVIGYGISERILPGLLHFARSQDAQGRLEQPLTYWNAMGAVAAIGLVLCARLAGDPTRSRRMRLAAAAATGPLGAGLYLSLSRGAIAAAATGLLVLLLLVPGRAQLRGVVVTVVAAVVCAVPAGVMSGVRTLQGSLTTREGEGLGLLAVMLAVATVAVLVLARSIARERPREQSGVPGLAPRRRLQYAVLAAVVVAGAFAAAAGFHERQGLSPAATGAARTQRLVSLESDRYAYWGVALHAFSHHPVIGTGAGGFATEWLAHRNIPAATVDAHSLYIQTLSELGLVGLAMLLVFLGGVAVCARRAWLTNPAAATGLIGALSVWLVHAGLDWDWEMPAVSLIALALMGGLIALAEPAVDEEAAPPELVRPSAPADVTGRRAVV